MAAPGAPNPHDELATRIGTLITQDLWRTLPEVADALGPQMLDSCRFSAHVVFRNTTAGIMVEIQTDKNIPIPAAEPIALGWLGEAMSLLPQQPVAAAQPIPQAGAAAGGYNTVQQPPPPVMTAQHPAIAAAQPPPRQDTFPGRRRPLADEGGIS